MIAIIVGLIVTLIIFVVVVSAIQQHKEKENAEKRIKVAKQKAIIDESEEMISSLSNVPSSPNLSVILNRRSFNAAKAMQHLTPENKTIKSRLAELKTRLESSEKLASEQGNEDNFQLPSNEQQLLAILQCLKKLRMILKSEQSKDALEPSIFKAEDERLAGMQLKINIESLINRGKQAQNKEMIGSARQYFEKALQTLSKHPHKTEYVLSRHAEISEQLEEITDSLKVTNASDAAKKAKDEENELDVIFQPKKKW